MRGCTKHKWENIEYIFKMKGMDISWYRMVQFVVYPSMYNILDLLPILCSRVGLEG